MTQTGFQSRSPFGGAVLLLGFSLAMGVVGCGGQGAAPPQLMLQSVQHGQTFSQQFSRAYVVHSTGGDADVVLVDRAAELAVEGRSSDAPVRQVMHIRVMWNPKSDQKTDHSSASNAAVHWYVLGNTPQNACDVLEYAGTAFVTVDEEGSQTELTVRNASIAPVACRGALQDPVGSSVFQGTIVAAPNQQRVRQVLSSVCTAVASAGGLPVHPASGKPESPSSLAR